MKYYFCYVNNVTFYIKDDSLWYISRNNNHRRYESIYFIEGNKRTIHKSILTAYNKLRSYEIINYKGDL